MTNFKNKYTRIDLHTAILVESEKSTRKKYIFLLKSFRDGEFPKRQLLGYISGRKKHRHKGYYYECVFNYTGRLLRLSTCNKIDDGINLIYAEYMKTMIEREEFFVSDQIYESF